MLRKFQHQDFNLDRIMTYFDCNNNFYSYCKLSNRYEYLATHLIDSYYNSLNSNINNILLLCCHILIVIIYNKTKLTFKLQCTHNQILH